MAAPFWLKRLVVSLLPLSPIPWVDGQRRGSGTVAGVRRRLRIPRALQAVHGVHVQGLGVLLRAVHEGALLS